MTARADGSGAISQGQSCDQVQGALLHGFQQSLAAASRAVRLPGLHQGEVGGESTPASAHAPRRSFTGRAATVWRTGHPGGRESAAPDGSAPDSGSAPPAEETRPSPVPGSEMTPALPSSSLRACLSRDLVGHEDDRQLRRDAVPLPEPPQPLGEARPVGGRTLADDGDQFARRGGSMAASRGMARYQRNSKGVGEVCGDGRRPAGKRRQRRPAAQ